MPRLLCYLLLIALFTACGKNNNRPRVDFFLLSSFDLVVDTTTNPAIHRISNPVLSDAPFIANNAIIAYSQANRTFRLNRDVSKFFDNLNRTNAFAVTVNNQPVYYGVFHASYLSSLIFGLPTLDPLRTNSRELPVNYIFLTGSSDLSKLDKRNDNQLMQALKASRRIE
jgi:hypothetical protein